MPIFQKKLDIDLDIAVLDIFLLDKADIGHKSLGHEKLDILVVLPFNWFYGTQTPLARLQTPFAGLKNPPAGTDTRLAGPQTSFYRTLYPTGTNSWF